MFATRTPETIDLFSISGVLFEWDTDAGLVSSAWTQSSHEEMLVFLHVDLSMNLEQQVDYLPFDIDLPMLQTALIESDTAGPVAPAPFDNGLFFNDPLQPTISSMDNPTQLLEPLETIGHSATATIGGANVGPPSPADDCPRSIANIIDWVKAGAEAEIMLPGSFLDGYQTARANSGCATCEETDVIISTPTPWVVTCQSWTPVDTILLSGCRAQTKFRRTIIGTRSRTKTKVCEDCSVIQCTSDQSFDLPPKS